MRKIILLSLLLVLLISCAPADTSQSTYLHSGVCRVIDEEAGVVCWLYYQNGISCLPISETDLERS